MGPAGRENGRQEISFRGLHFVYKHDILNVQLNSPSFGPFRRAFFFARLRLPGQRERRAPGQDVPAARPDGVGKKEKEKTVWMSMKINIIR